MSTHRRIRGATWQAGMTAGNEGLRPLLNGQPVPGAFAASTLDGWVMCHPEPELQRVRPSARAPLGLAYLTDEFRDKVLRTGKVTMARSPGE